MHFTKNNCTVPILQVWKMMQLEQVHCQNKVDGEWCGGRPHREEQSGSEATTSGGHPTELLPLLLLPWKSWPAKQPERCYIKFHPLIREPLLVNHFLKCLDLLFPSKWQYLNRISSWLVQLCCDSSIATSSTLSDCLQWSHRCDIRKTS